MKYFYQIIFASIAIVVASNASASSECEDHPNLFFMRSKYRDCAWITRIASKIDIKCKFPRAQIHCPSSCNACDKCADSNARFKVPSSTGNSGRRSCKWVGELVYIHFYSLLLVQNCVPFPSNI